MIKHCCLAFPIVLYHTRTLTKHQCIVLILLPKPSGFECLQKTLRQKVPPHGCGMLMRRMFSIVFWGVFGTPTLALLMSVFSLRAGMPLMLDVAVFVCVSVCVFVHLPVLVCRCLTVCKLLVFRQVC